MKVKRLFAIGGILTAAALSQPVLAALNCNADGGQTIAAWAGASDKTCSWEGLNYVYISSSAALNTVYAQTKTQSGWDILNFSTWSGVPLPSTPYQVVYSVEFDSVLRPNEHFIAADLTSDTRPGVNSTTMTRQFFATSAMDIPLGSTLSSLNSMPSPTTNTAISGLTKLWVLDTFGWTGASVVNSSTDYLQTAPEPATLALFCVGLAGLAARTRHNRIV